MDQIKAGQIWAKTVLQQISNEKNEFEEKAEFLASVENGILVCEGDSWFDYHPGYNKDILKWLRRYHKYDVRETPANGGDTLQKIANNADQLAALNSTLEEILDEGKEPRAILLSAGGNDITGDVLASLLNHKTSGLPPINEAMADAFFAKIGGFIRKWIGAVNELCDQHFSKQYPIFVHGYCYPVPDGDAFGWNGIGWFPGPWLKPAFETQGYWVDEGRRRSEVDALKETTPIMEDLIVRFNNILQEESESGILHHIDFQGQPSNGLPKQYKDWWANELHPEREGFKTLAADLSRQLEEKLEALRER